MPGRIRVDLISSEYNFLILWIQKYIDWAFMIQYFLPADLIHDWQLGDYRIHRLHFSPQNYEAVGQK